jgi:hypothetical protein
MTCRLTEKKVFQHTRPFDGEGYLYYIATRGNTCPWKNPHDMGYVHVLVHPTHDSFDHCDPADVVNYHEGGRFGTAYNHSQGEKHYAVLDLIDNPPLCPTHYSLCHTRTGWSGKLRYWNFEGSNDGNNWTLLREHRDDKSINGDILACSWKIENCNIFYRYFRVLGTGCNSDGPASIHIGTVACC